MRSEIRELANDYTELMAAGSRLPWLYKMQDETVSLNILTVARYYSEKGDKEVVPILI